MEECFIFGFGFNAILKGISSFNFTIDKSDNNEHIWENISIIVKKCGFKIGKFVYKLQNHKYFGKQARYDILVDKTKLDW